MQNKKKDFFFFFWLWRKGEKKEERSTPEYLQHPCTHGFYKNIDWLAFCWSILSFLLRQPPANVMCRENPSLRHWWWTQNYSSSPYPDFQLCEKLLYAMAQLIFLTSVSCYLFHFSHFNKRKTNMEIHKELPLEDSGTEWKIKSKVLLCSWCKMMSTNTYVS